MKSLSVTFATALCAFVVLSSGCMSVSPITAARLAATDPLAVDPGALSVAIELPEPIHIRTGDATLRLAVEGKLDETFVLSIDGKAKGGAGASPPGAGRHVLAAGIAPADRDRFARAQAIARDLRARGDGDKGSLTVSISGGCRTGELGNVPLGATISIRTAERYFPLASIDLGASMGADTLRRLPGCARG